MFTYWEEHPRSATPAEWSGMAMDTSAKAGIVVAVVVALVVGIFIGTALDGGSEDGDATRATIPVINLGGPGSYLALGDSYSAGEGLPDYDPDTADLPIGDRCHRSLEYAYPLKLVFADPTQRDFRACSGAVVKNVFRIPQSHGGQPISTGRQIEEGTIEDSTLLVTITMGGNDLEFADMLIFCAGHSSCQNDTFEEGLTLSDWAQAHLATIGKELEAMYIDLREQTPAQARILVLGYPGLFPQDAPSPFVKPVCSTVFAGFSDAEEEAIRAWNIQLNEVVHAATSRAGVEFVDVYSFFSGHEVCGRAGAWLKSVGNPSRVERDGWFHPTRTGQGMLARIVACYLDVYRASDEVAANDPADVFRLSSCVADNYPSDSAASVSLPTPSQVAG